MQQGNFINVLLARHVSGTYAHILKTLQQGDHIINKTQIKHLTQKKTYPSNPKRTTQATQTWHTHKTDYQKYRRPLL